jgi:cytochrome c oxidase subunit 2
MRCTIRLAAAICAVVAMLSPFTSASAESLDLSYCLTCHGTNGNGNPAIRAPKIAGMEPWYLKRQLDAFAAGSRGVNAADEAGHEMQPVGLRLKEAGITDKAIEFVGTFQATAPAVTVAGDQLRGKTLYVTCAACHGAKGEGNVALNAPALAARTDWYLVTQLKNFASGARGGDGADAPAAQMRAIASTLTDASAVNDVVAYINTLR